MEEATHLFIIIGALEMPFRPGQGQPGLAIVALRSDLDLTYLWGVQVKVRRLGVTAEELPPAYAIATLMNPMFGRKANIVGSGSMTEEQYNNGREAL
eukprot:scaffold20280_cov78-Cyclotella_meneghiniana.AAC.2